MIISSSEECAQERVQEHKNELFKPQHMGIIGGTAKEDDHNGNEADPDQALNQNTKQELVILKNDEPRDVENGDLDILSIPLSNEIVSYTIITKENAEPSQIQSSVMNKNEAERRALVSRTSADAENGIYRVSGGGGGNENENADDDDDDDDDEYSWEGRRRRSHSFEASCRLIMSIGAAAYRYGSTGANVETFLEQAMIARYGSSCVNGVFKLTQSEMFACIILKGGRGQQEQELPPAQPQPQQHYGHSSRSISNINAESTNTVRSRTHDDVSVTYMIKIQEGVHLTKLGIVVDVAKGFLHGTIGLEDAVEQLDKIHLTPDPFSSRWMLASFAMTGGGLAMLLGGTWYDVLLAMIMGGLNHLIQTVFTTILPQHVQKFSNTVTTFVLAAITNLVKMTLVPSLNVTMITLSAVAIQLPGYTISIGLFELASNRVVAGMAHFVRGIVELSSLALGAWFGVYATETILLSIWQSHPPPEVVVDASSVVPPPPIQMIYQTFFVPLLFLALGVAFQISRRDFPWAMLNLCIAYGTSVGMRFATHGSTITTKGQYVGTFLSSVVFTITANIWGRWQDRPNTLVLMPCIVLSVSGSIGFQGIMNLANGEAYLAANQFLQMLVVAVMTFGGVLVGQSIFPPQTTL